MKSKKKLPDTTGDLNDLVQRLKPLVEQVERLKKEASALGIFVADRELLDCPECRLQEDVLADGRLITCDPERPSVDTKGKFVEVREGLWRCANCGCEFRVSK